MVRFEEKYSYAALFLKQNGMKIFSGNKQILLYEPTRRGGNPQTYLLQDNKVETKIVLGQKFFLEEQTRFIRRYDDLRKRFGLKISSRHPTRRNYVTQKVEFYFSKLGSPAVDIGEIPQYHRVEHDITNNILKLLGKNAYNQPLLINKKGIPPYVVINHDPSAQLNAYAQMLKKMSPLPTKQELKYFSIPDDEIVIMETEDGRLATIREEIDSPVMAILGMRGKGKSLLLHRLADNLYFKWHKKVINTNDITPEAETWCLRWAYNSPFKRRLTLINEPTLRLPMVYLHPHLDNMKTSIHKGTVGYDISLPFQTIIQDYENVFKGKEDWKMEKSLKYFKALVFDEFNQLRPDGLAFKTSYDEMRKLVETEVLAKQEGMRNQFLHILRDLCALNFLDITSNIPPTWKLKLPSGETFENAPWITCLAADLIPNIITSDLEKKPVFPLYYKYITNSVMEFQTTNFSTQNQLEIYMIIDEIARIASTKKPNVGGDALEKLASGGRPKRLGMLYASQYPDRILPEVRENTDYVISFKQKKTEANTTAKDFDMPEFLEKEILKLKKFECVASGPQFILYDNQGNKEIAIETSIRGKAFPSLSRHKAPKDVPRG